MVMPKVNPAEVEQARCGMPSMKMADRFWSKVDIRGDSECWPWTKATRNGGYGVFVLAPGDQRVASRVAWMFSNARPVPDELVIRHKCDNPPCCNPAHLEPGTQSDNMTDCFTRGRAYVPIPLKGEAHGNAKLSDQDAADMRQLRKRGATGPELARLLNIGRSQVYRITRGESRAGD